MKAPKFFKIFFIVILVLIILVLVSGFIFLKTFDVKRYKPQIIEQASAALGRPFNFQDIQLQVSLGEGIRLNLKQLTIGDDPHFRQGDFLKVEDVFLGVDVLSVVTRGTIAVSKVQVLSPQIVLMKNSQGELNAQTIGTKQESAVGAPGPAGAASPGQPASPAPLEKKEPAKPAALPPIAVDSISVENATITYTDQSFDPPLSVQADQLGLQVSNFSLNRLFSFAVSGRVLSPEKNFQVNGKAKVDIGKSEFTGNNITISTDLGKLALEQIKALPMLAEVPFPQILKGQLQVNVKEVVAGLQGVAKLTADVDLAQGAVAVAEAVPGVSLEAEQIGVKLTNFSLDKPFDFKVQAAYFSPQPNVNLEGQATLDLAAQAVRLKNTNCTTDFSLLSLPKLRSSHAMFKNVPFPDVLEGKLNVSVKDLAAGAQGLGKIAADVQFSDGRVRLKEIVKGVSFEAGQIALKLTDASLDKPFPFLFQSAYLSSVPNITLNGQVQVFMEEQMVQLKNTNFSTDLSNWNLEQLKTLVTSKDVPLPQSLSGKLSLTVNEATAGPKGLVSLVSQGELANGSVKLKEMAVPISPIRTKFATTQSRFTLEDFFVGLGQGSVKAGALADDFLGKQIFNADVVLNNINLAEILEQENKPYKIEGLMLGQLKVSGQGFQNTDLIKGEGGLELQKGKILDLNILKTVIDKITILPNLADKLIASLPPESRQKMQKKDTILNKVEMKTTISQGTIAIDPITIDADGFEFLGDTQAKFDQNFSTQGSFFIPQDLSAEIVRIVPELQFLLENEKIYLPLKVSGNTAKMSFFVDPVYISSKVIKSKGKEQIQKVLDKVLGNDEEDQPAQSPGGTPPAPKEKKPEQEIIENILDSIFK